MTNNMSDVDARDVVGGGPAAAVDAAAAAAAVVPPTVLPDAPVAAAACEFHLHLLFFRAAACPVERVFCGARRSGDGGGVPGASGPRCDARGEC